MRDNQLVALALRTPLCRELGIEYPVFSVGFGFSAGPELVSAVSGAGGCGVLGGGGLPAEEIRRRIARVRELTDRPFGVNVTIAELEQLHFADEDRAFVREEIAAAVAAAGVDAVIAQGIEAGGHGRGTTSIWELLPAAVEAVKPVPVLASGGIGDGAGLARALQLGAQGVSLGTRFVASEEASIHPVYKQRVVDSSAEDTFYGELFDVWWPDAPHRVLRNNKIFAEWDAAGRPPPGDRPGEGTPIGTSRRPYGDYEWPRYAVGMVTPDFDGDPEYAP